LAVGVADDEAGVGFLDQPRRHRRKPENDDPSIIEPIAIATSAA
jgi:hypothetical protein